MMENNFDLQEDNENNLIIWEVSSFLFYMVCLHNSQKYNMD